jgi:hypothetical protein
MENIKTLSEINLSEINKAVNDWKKELKDGNHIKLSFIDFYGLSKSFKDGQISIEDVNTALMPGKGVYDKNYISQLLENNKLTVTRCFYQGLTCYMEIMNVSNSM